MKERVKFIASKAGPLSAFVVTIGAMASDVISQSEYRDSLPDFMEEQSGNLGAPATIIMVAHLIGTMAELKGIATGKKWLEQTGKALRPHSVTLMIGITIGVELQFIKDLNLLKENLPDAGFGTISIGLGLIVGNSIKTSLENRFIKKNTSKIDKEAKKRGFLSTKPLDFATRLKFGKNHFSKYTEKNGEVYFQGHDNAKKWITALESYGPDVVAVLMEEKIINLLESRPEDQHDLALRLKSKAINEGWNQDAIGTQIGIAVRKLGF